MKPDREGWRWDADIDTFDRDPIEYADDIFGRTRIFWWNGIRAELSFRRLESMPSVHELSIRQAIRTALASAAAREAVRRGFVL